MSQSVQTLLPQTGRLINNRNLFLVVVEAGSPGLGCQRGWVLIRTADVSLCPRMVEGTREISGVPFIRALLPFVKPPSL